MLQHPQAAIGNARQAAAIFTDLGVKPALTTEWCTLAQCYRLLGDDEQAIKYTQRAFDLLEELGGEGPDYPHRDYLTCYQIFDQLGRSELAIIALNKAYRILSEKATKISDLGTQSSFLANVAFNRQIVEAATSHGMIFPVPVAGQERDNRQES